VASQLSAITLNPAWVSSGIRYSWVPSRREFGALTEKWISGTSPSFSQKPSPLRVHPFSSSSATAPSGSYVSVKIGLQYGPGAIGPHSSSGMPWANGA